MILLLIAPFVVLIQCTQTTQSYAKTSNPEETTPARYKYTKSPPFSNIDDKLTVIETSFFPPVDYPTSVLEATPFFFKSNNEILEPFSDEVKKFFKSITKEKNSQLDKMVQAITSENPNTIITEQIKIIQESSSDGNSDIKEYKTFDFIVTQQNSTTKFESEFENIVLQLNRSLTENLDKSYSSETNNSSDESNEFNSAEELQAKQSMPISDQNEKYNFEDTKVVENMSEQDPFESQIETPIFISAEEDSQEKNQNMNLLKNQILNETEVNSQSNNFVPADNNFEQLNLRVTLTDEDNTSDETLIDAFRYNLIEDSRNGNEFNESLCDDNSELLNMEESQVSKRNTTAFQIFNPMKEMYENQIQPPPLMDATELSGLNNDPQDNNENFVNLGQILLPPVDSAELISQTQLNGALPGLSFLKEHEVHDICFSPLCESTSYVTEEPPARLILTNNVS